MLSLVLSKSIVTREGYEWDIIAGRFWVMSKTANASALMDSEGNVAEVTLTKIIKFLRELKP